MLIARRVVMQGHLELFDVFRREFRPVDGKGQLIELAGKPEGGLIVLIINQLLFCHL